MNHQQARQKEARRTLQRIRGTLHRLQEGSAWDQPLEQTDEFKRMKQLLESGYQPDRALSARLKALFRKPLVWFALLMLCAALIEWSMR